MSFLNFINVTDFSLASLHHFKNHLFNLLFERDMADWVRRVRIERLSAGLPLCLALALNYSVAKGVSPCIASS